MFTLFLHINIYISILYVLWLIDIFIKNVYSLQYTHTNTKQDQDKHRYIK